MSVELSVGDRILLKPLKDVRGTHTMDVLGLNEFMVECFGKWHFVTSVHTRNNFTVFEIDDGYIYAKDWIEARITENDIKNEVLI